MTMVTENPLHPEEEDKMDDAKNDEHAQDQLLARTEDKEVETERKPKPSLYRRFLTDADCRRKGLLTLNVCFSYLMLGWITVQVGVSLMDLQYQVRIDLETSAWIFTSWSLGFMVGSLVSGQLFDRLNRLAIMGVCSIGSGLCCLAVPWCPNFTLLVIVRVLAGMFMGSLDTGSNTIVPSIWGSEAAPFMQVLYLSFTIGGIVSPLVTSPFLDPLLAGGRHHPETSDIYTTLNDSLSGNTSVTLSSLTMPSYAHNQTLYLAFLVSCIFTVMTAIPYLIMGYHGGFDVRCSSGRKNREVIDDLSCEESGKIAFKQKCIVLAFIGIVNFTYSATEESVGDFLVTFCLLELGWGKGHALTLMSVYWITSCIGAVIGILIVNRIGITTLIMLAFVGWLVSFIGLLVSSTLQIDGLVWASVALAGLFMVLILPMVISWVEIYVCDISGTVSSVFMISTGIGLTVNPIAIGNAMERISNMYFIYIFLAEMIVCFSCFVISYLATKQFTKGKTREHTVTV